MYHVGLSLSVFASKYGCDLRQAMRRSSLTDPKPCLIGSVGPRRRGHRSQSGYPSLSISATAKTPTPGQSSTSKYHPRPARVAHRESCSCCGRTGPDTSAGPDAKTLTLSPFFIRSFMMFFASWFRTPSEDCQYAMQNPTNTSSPSQGDTLSRSISNVAPPRRSNPPDRLKVIHGELKAASAKPGCEGFSGSVTPLSAHSP
jgi:hypothetical protein